MWPTDVTPFLDPDEHVVAWFNAVSGPSWAVWLEGTALLFPDPRVVIFLPLLLPLVRVLRVRRYRVVLTDRSILALRRKFLTGKPHHVDICLPRETQLGPFEGRGWIRLGGIRMFASEISDKQAVQDADEDMGFPRPVPGIW